MPITGQKFLITGGASLIGSHLTRALLAAGAAEVVLHDNLSLGSVHHVVDMGWSSKRNGELLQLMVADGFDARLTVDQSLEFQQNLGAVGVGVVVVLAKSNRVTELRPLVPLMLAALGPANSRRVDPGWKLTNQEAPVLASIAPFQRGVRNPRLTG